MNRPRILVVGSLVMDMITSSAVMPADGATVLGKSFRAMPGGKGANQAVQAARLGAEVTMVGRVGDDEFGRALTASLKQSGVSAEHVVTTPGVATAVGNIILTEAAGTTLNNRIIVVPGANMCLNVNDVAFLEDSIDEYDMVMLQMEIPIEVNQCVARYAAAKNLPVMLNPAPIAPIPEDLLENITYLSPNETETEGLLGIKLDVGPEGPDEHTVEKIRKAMSAKKIGKLLVTLGKAGAAIIEPDRMTFRGSVPGVQVADPTAAGDSFVAAFCIASCWGVPDSRALEFANSTAAITVTEMGAQPSLPDLDAVLSGIAVRGKAFPTPVYDEPVSVQTKRVPAEDALDNFLCSAKKEFARFADGIDWTGLYDAAEMIGSAAKTGHRLHITGIGKPGHLAKYAAALFSSTGIPAYFLHGTEAVHGSAGQLVEGDVVICISNSGETYEMKATVNAVKNNGCRLIGISGNPKSWLAENSEIHLCAGVKEEGGPLNRAPRNSINAEMLLLQALSVITQASRGLSVDEYILRHPGGMLGKK